MWEDAAVGFRAGHARILAEWDSGGRRRQLPADYSEGVTTFTPWLIVRLHRRAELQAWTPWMLNDRSSGDTRQVAGGLGDAGAGVRFEAVSIGEYAHMPSLAITLGGLAPTGRRVEETSPPLFAGATGQGGWGSSVAVTSEYAFSPWFVRVDVGRTYFFSMSRPDSGVKQRPGPIWDIALMVGREVLSENVVAALGCLWQQQEPLTVGGREVSDSSSRLFTLAGSLSWRLAPHWTLLATLSDGMWPDGWGKNRDSRLGATVGARYGYF